jgi:hypothetical protein
MNEENDPSWNLKSKERFFGRIYGQYTEGDFALLKGHLIRDFQELLEKRKGQIIIEDILFIIKNRFGEADD